MKPRTICLRTSLLVGLVLSLSASASPSDILVDLLAIPGSAGLGAILRSERTPYKNAAMSYDLISLYIYEGKRMFLHASRIGVKFTEQQHYGFDLFLDYRFEGHPFDQSPPILAGMRKHNPSVDVGAAYR